MTIGFRVNSGAFAKNSWHFRNALVRENYNDLEDGVHITAKVFKMFFSNFILGMELLKNQYVYVDGNSQSVSHRVPKSQSDTLECTLEELAVLELISKNPSNKKAVENCRLRQFSTAF